jgi:hypothetical protein
MTSPISNFLKVPIAFLQTGISMMDAGTRVLHAGIAAMTPGNGKVGEKPPIGGAQNMSMALAEVVSQAVRIGTITPLGTQEVLDGVGDVVRVARRSFGYLDPRDPRILALPIELPLTAGSIFADTLMRMITVYQVAGVRRMPKMLRDAVELYSDTAMFVKLEYKTLIDRLSARLERNPGDHETRMKLGRLYIKCGLYDYAIKQLEPLTDNPGMRAQAWHELLIAQYRSGRMGLALDAGLEAMKADPGNDRARNMLWLASHGAGGYPERVPAEFRMEAKCGYAPTRLRYENIASRIGLYKTNSGRGAVVFDYNNDGYLDVAITGPHSGCSLYRNNGDGTFTDVSIEAGLDGCINGWAIVAGDYDNDGYQDLFVTRLGFYHGQGTLFHNNGDGTFTDVTEKAGLNTWGPAFTAHWVDYDCDGNLDLFVTYNFADLFDKHFQNRLFHNNGDGTFTDVTAQSGLHATYTTIGSSWGDYDNDGYPDLFLNSFMGKPALFRNNRDGTFTDVSEQAGMNDMMLGFVCMFCDYDNDGWMDIAQFIWSDHEDFVHTLRNGKGPDDSVPMRIYHNNRDGTFTAKDREIGLDGAWGTMSGNMADINNDGYLDIVLGNGSPRMERLEPPTVLEFDGTKFRNTTFAAGLPFAGKGHGIDFADLFGDGRLSVIIANGGAYPGDLHSTAVYYPNELPGNYLNVRVRGTKCNRDGIGAKITLRTGETQQNREVFAGSAFGSLPYEQHFGLGRLERVDSLQIADHPESAGE